MGLASIGAITEPTILPISTKVRKIFCGPDSTFLVLASNEIITTKKAYHQVNITTTAAASPIHAADLPHFKPLPIKMGIVENIISSNLFTIIQTKLPISKMSSMYQLFKTDRYPTGIIGDGVEGSVMLYKHLGSHEIMAVKKLKDPENSGYELPRDKAIEVLRQA